MRSGQVWREHDSLAYRREEEEEKEEGGRMTGNPPPDSYRGRPRGMHEMRASHDIEQPDIILLDGHAKQW
jgi:hypothetical protein